MDRPTLMIKLLHENKTLWAFFKGEKKIKALYFFCLSESLKQKTKVCRIFKLVIVSFTGLSAIKRTSTVMHLKPMWENF